MDIAGFMAQVLSQKHSKLTHTFQRRQALKEILSQREELGTAIRQFEASKLEALDHALKAALRSGFASADLHLSAARHGLVAVAASPARRQDRRGLVAPRHAPGARKLPPQQAHAAPPCAPAAGGGSRCYCRCS